MIKLGKYKINKNDSIIIGVSGGPDSMALLDMLVKSGYKPIVCHVNYHHRKTADRDENIVKNYCFSNNLVFYLSNYVEKESGNFQDEARIFRYHFFKEIYDIYKCKALLIAHQQDDALETYLLKKERNSKANNLSLVDDEYNFEMRIIRPLLDYRKKDLEEYCASHSIKYGIDESNLSNDYSRNKIRNEIINKVSDEEYKKMISDMNIDIKKWEKEKKKAFSIMFNDNFLFSDLLKLSKEQQYILLTYFISKNCPKLSRNISTGRLEQIIFELNNNNFNAETCLEDDIYFVRNDDLVFIYKVKQIETIFLKSSTDLCKYNKKFGAKMEGIAVLDTDYPLTIRNYNDNDIIKIQNGTKKVSKLLKDKKIPLIIRQNWLVIENNKHEIIYVNKYYRHYDRKNLQNNLYII